MTYENMSNDELIALKNQLQTESGQYDAKQMAFKILLNSAYGAIGNSHFRHYNYNEATAITISGQACLKWVSRKVNEYLNGLLKTKNKDYVVYGDTDSIYVDFTDIVNKFAANRTENETVDAIQKIADIKINEVIEKAYSEFSERTNAFENHLDMKREAIGPAVFIKKKKYTMRVYDSEGVRYTKPKMKIMGLEAVRSSVPEFCRNEIKKTLEMIFTHTEQDVVLYIDDVRNRFNNLPLVEIAMPTGVKNIAEYDTGDGFKSGAPMHVKASIIFNRMIDKFGLKTKYAKIMEGEKVKVVSLMKPNPLMADAIAFPEKLPVEFGLDKYIDREDQFNKTYLEPMKRVLDTIGWKSDNTVSIEDFFC